MAPNQPQADPDSLEEIAMISMEFGKMLMECGAGSAIVDEYATRVATALGAESVDLRIGYASLAITVRVHGKGIARMRRVGSIGVNQRLDQAVRQLARRVEAGDLARSDVAGELERVTKDSPRYPGWFIDLAVGLACASFGRLLGVDWLAFGFVFAAAAIGQFVRRLLLRRNVNVFITATLVAFLASVLSGIGSRFAGSATVDTAMTAAVLLLVPGVPSLNAQYDILYGRPTLGSARAVWVAVIMIFLTIGVWLGQMALGEGL
ncbi:MAG: threonine/serine exporter family protein [Opitutaceae bacterium]